MEAQVSSTERDGERRQFGAHGYATLTTAGGVTMLRGVFEPGWRWSTDIAPIAGTSACQTHHLGYVVSGEMAIRLDDGTEFRMRAGDLFDIPPGHDAWVDGPEVCVAVDYSSDATRYARAATAAEALEPPENADMLLVRKGFAAFNTGDIDTLRSVIAPDAVQHVPGKSLISGTYRGIDNILGYYGKLAELTDGTLRAHLLEVHGDGQGHVVAIFQGVGTRNSVTRVDRQSLFFTIDKGQAVDIVELHADLPGSDAFFS